MAFHSAFFATAAGMKVEHAAAFHAAMRERALEALDRSGGRTRVLLLAGRRIRLSFAGDALESRLIPALSHLASPDPEGPGGADLDVLVFDSASTRIQAPPPPWAPEQMGPRGVIDGFNTPRFRTVYQPGADVLFLYDAESVQGVYWTPDAERVPFWETSFPFRTLLQWWAEGCGLQLAHAAAVGLDHGGVLITGPGGSGKTTSALACLGSRLRYAGDDFVLLETSPPRVHCLYNTAKLTRETEAWFPHLAAMAVNRHRPAEEKAMLLLAQSMPHALIGHFPLRYLLVARVTGKRETRITRCGGGEALRALAPTTLFQLPLSGKAAMDGLAELVRRVPAFRLEAGTDLAGIPRAIAGLLEGE